jgi:hypothetical protein
MIKEGKKYLVTTDNWFIAPDGNQYRSAWGICYIKTLFEEFNFTPLRPSTNWFLEVGANGKKITIGGFQIHFVIECENMPEDKLKNVTYIEKDTGLEILASKIYIAE